MIFTLFSLFPQLKLEMDEEPDTSQSGYDCESPLPTRNPSPPPELRDNEEAMADIIKGTMISKEWIFSIFLKLIEVRTSQNLCCHVRFVPK